MGKKSLTKSTTKKKAAAKKPSETKKTTETKTASPAPTAKEMKPTQNAKSAPSPEKATKPAASQKSAPSSKASAPAKKPNLASLLKKDFGTWAPQKLYTPPKPESGADQFTAPPFIDLTDADAAKRLKELLARQFDLTAMAKAPKTEKAPAAKAPEKKTEPPKPETPKKAAEKPAAATAAPKKPVSMAELIQRNFGDWKPETLYAPPADLRSTADFTAPPAIDAQNPAEAQRLRDLIAKPFDFSDFVSAAREPAPVIEKPKAQNLPEAPAKPAKTPEPVSQPTPVKAETPAPETAAEAPKAAPEPEAMEKPAPPEKPVEPPKPAEKPAIPETPAPKAAEAPKAAPVPPKPEAKKPAPPEKSAKPPAEPKKEAPKAPEKQTIPPAPPAAPKPVTSKEPPINPALALLIGLIVCVFGLLIIASAMNTRHYYLEPADNGVEIWRGKFSPTGKRLVMTVPGAVLPEPVKPEYSRGEALVPAFDYYIRKAEALTEVKGPLDFEAIKSTLRKAMEFAPTRAHEKDVTDRLNKIDFMFMVYKADVAAGKNTLEGYAAALEQLGKAAALRIDTPAAVALVKKKTQDISAAKAALEEKLAEEQAAAVVEEASVPAPDGENAPAAHPEDAPH